jgi:hypothetical protein
MRNALIYHHWLSSSQGVEFQQFTISLSGVNALRACGDSITIGQGASPSSEGYIQQFSTQRGLSLTNQAVGARGIWNQVSAIQGVGFTPTQTLVTCMVGLNDMKRNGASIKTVNKILTGFRAIAFKCIRSSTRYSGDSLVTRANGSFTPYNAASVGGLGLGTALGASNLAASFSVSTGATWTHSFTASSSLPGIGVQLIGADGVLYSLGVCEILIDGVVVDTIDTATYYDGVSDGAYDNGRGPVVFMYHGLSAGAHTIQVRQVSGTIAVDFFAQLNQPPSSARILFAEIPYCTPTGYLAPPNGSISASDICSQAIYSVVTELRDAGYLAAFVKTNSYYDSVNSGDGTHPDNTGYDQITSAFNASIQ